MQCPVWTCTGSALAFHRLVPPGRIGTARIQTVAQKQRSAAVKLGWKSANDLEIKGCTSIFPNQYNTL